MTLDLGLRDCMLDTVSVASFASQDAYGGRSHGTAVTYPCRVEHKQTLVRGVDGRNTVAASKVLIGPTSTGGYPGLTVQDKLLINGGTDAPPILAVGRMGDGISTGTYYEVAFLG